MSEGKRGCNESEERAERARLLMRGPAEPRQLGRRRAGQSPAPHAARRRRSCWPSRWRSSATCSSRPGTRVVSEAHCDICLQYAPWRDFGFSQLRHGNFALWNPHIYSGAPFFGGVQSGLLYPLNFPYLFLPLARAINMGVALHVFLGGLFMYLWASRRGLRFLACLFCGVLWMFCGQHYYHIMAGHLTGLISTAWIPLLFLALDGMFEDETPLDSALRTPQLRKFKWILLGSLTIAMMALGGDPQYLFHVGVAAAIYSGLCLVRAANRMRILTGLAAMCAVGAAIAAVQLLSGMETTAESLRGGHGVTYDFARVFWLPPENFLTFLAPGFFGPEVWNGVFRYWGRCFLWEMCLFIGVTGLLLAIYGAIAGERAKRRFSLAMVLALLVLALGAWLPPIVTGAFPFAHRRGPPAEVLESGGGQAAAAAVHPDGAGSCCWRRSWRCGGSRRFSTSGFSASFTTGRRGSTGSAACRNSPCRPRRSWCCFRASGWTGCCARRRSTRAWRRRRCCWRRC